MEEKKLEYKILDIKAIKLIYDHLIFQDFPENEVRSYENIKRNIEKGNYYCVGCFKNDDIVAYAFVLEIPDSKVILVDYIAVLKHTRGLGVGKDFFDNIPKLFKNTQAIMVEIEPVSLANDGKEKDQRRRRENFYTSLGFKKAPINVELFGVPFNILALALSSDTSTDGESIKTYLEKAYHSLLEQETVKKHIKIEIA